MFWKCCCPGAAADVKDQGHGLVWFQTALRVSGGHISGSTDPLLLFFTVCLIWHQQAGYLFVFDYLIVVVVPSIINLHPCLRSQRSQMLLANL